MAAPTEPIACRSYTHARRYPWVIGKIGGCQLPTQLTLAQLLAISATLAALLATRGAWAHLPRMANLLVEVSVPAATGWAARHLQVEGRSPLRALAGFVGYCAAPRLGTARGRPYRPARPVWLAPSLPIGWLPPAATAPPGRRRRGRRRR
jgi:hypothetical protein